MAESVSDDNAKTIISEQQEIIDSFRNFYEDKVRNSQEISPESFNIYNDIRKFIEKSDEEIDLFLSNYKDEVLSILKGIEGVLIGQRYSFDEEEDFCNKEYIVAEQNGNHIGSIILYMNKNFPYAIIQEITKFPIPAISDLLGASTQKVNQVLIPEVEKIAKRNMYKYLIVSPIGKQEKILKTYYGFSNMKQDVDYDDYCAAISISTTSQLFKRI